MKTVCYLAVPFVKEEVTLALESGVTCLVVPDESVELAQGLARCDIIPQSQAAMVALNTKADEEKALTLLTEGMVTILEKGWEIIPVENLLAHEERLVKSAGQALSGSGQPQQDTPAVTNNLTGNQRARLALEVTSAQEAELASKILERGVNLLVVPSSALSQISAILEAVNEEASAFALEEAVITSIIPVGIGHRVCVDTLSLLTSGQGMLVGNSAGFTFLVNAETEHNEYVASRPFRINAGAVHSYCMMPADTTAYLEELQAGREVLIVDKSGKTSTAVVGRCKVERRPMLHITAQIGDRQGSVFLQNAETIRLVRPDGTPTSVVNLTVGDTILCHLDTAGRHFGMRISEEIAEE